MLPCELGPAHNGARAALLACGGRPVQEAGKFERRERQLAETRWCDGGVRAHQQGKLQMKRKKLERGLSV